MLSTTHNHDPEVLIKKLLDTTVESIIPLTTKGVSTGSAYFGAAIFKRDTLELVHASTNNGRVSPLLHGEVNCIQEFFMQIPKDSRPHPKDCIFYATHEPCSLCLSAIAWSEFKEVYYLFAYEDFREEKMKLYDIEILEEVFKVRAEGDTEETLKNRPYYNRENRFFKASPVASVVEMLDDEKIKQCNERIAALKKQYAVLSKMFREWKGEKCM